MSNDFQGLKSGFYSSKNGDRLYIADDLNGFLDGLVGEGVFKNYKDGLEVVSLDPANREIQVKTGKAWFKRKYAVVDPPITLQIPSNVGSFYVVVNSRENDRETNIVVKSSITDSDLPLAMVSYNNSGTSILIDDLRGTSKCPWVAGLLANFTANEIVDQMDNPTFESYVKERVDLKMDPLYDSNETRFNELYSEEETKMDALHASNETRFNDLYNSNGTRFNELYSEEETKMDTLHDSNETRFNDLYDSLSSSTQDIVNEVLSKLPTVPLELNLTDENREAITGSADGTTEEEINGLIHAIVRTGGEETTS